MRTLKVAAIQTGPCADNPSANLARGLRLLRQANRSLRERGFRRHLAGKR